MPLQMIRDDLARVRVDAIVSPDNAELSYAGGASARLYEAAGIKEMTEACRKAAPCAPGAAVVTPGFRLPARYVIHTVGPVWQDGLHREQEILASCYTECLR